MFEVKQTAEFRKWRQGLKDSRVRAQIASRIDRLAFGLTGDAKPIGNGVSELRIHLGPGYRIYFHQQGSTIVILLCGDNKSSQARDIKKAFSLVVESDT